MQNKVYYLCGSDGSGKTTFIEEVEKVLISQNKSIKHIWLRSPKIFSKPLMLYARMMGHTKYRTIDGVRYGKHDFHQSKIISYLFPILQLLDFKIKWRKLKKGISDEDVLLFDRFSIDTLADLMVDTGRMNLHKSSIGKAFVKLVPVNSIIVIMHVDEYIIRARKKDTLYDEKLDLKLKVYQVLAKDLNISIINNNITFEKAKQSVFKKIGI